VHGAFNAPGRVDKAANQGPTTVGATILNCIDLAPDIEEGDIDIVQFYEFPSARRKVLECTSFEPVLKFHAELGFEKIVFSLFNGF